MDVNFSRPDLKVEESITNQKKRDILGESIDVFFLMPCRNILEVCV